MREHPHAVFFCVRKTVYRSIAGSQVEMIGM